MAEQYDDEDLDLSGADLVKDLRKQIKALQKEKADFAQELSTLKSTARERSVADVLSAKGVNAKVAKFIPSDVEGSEAISKWLDENADVFGFEVKSDTTTEPDPAAVAASQRLQTLGNSGTAPSRVQDLESRLANAKSDVEIEEIWKEAKNFFL